MKLTQCNIIGEQAAHFFEDAHGVKVRVECSLEEYRSLAEKNAGQPTLDGMKWLNSHSTYKYDTPTGYLEEGMYALTTDPDWVIVRVAGCKEMNVYKSYFVNGELNDAKVEELQRFNAI